MLLLNSTDACSSAAGDDKTPVLVGQSPATVVLMINSSCYMNESVAKRHGPQRYTDNKATATTTNSNNTGGGGGGNSSRNFIYALAAATSFVFLLIVCYAIWTFSIKTILPVVTESNKNLKDLQPNNMPPLLGNNVSGNWFSVYVEVTTASTVQIKNPFASETIAIDVRRKNRKRYRGRINRRFNRRFHRRFQYHSKRSETKDKSFNTVNSHGIDDRYRGVEEETENKPKDDILVVEGGELGVENKETLWGEFELHQNPPKHTLSSKSLLNLGDVRWVKCNKEEKRDYTDGMGDNMVERGDNQGERRNNPDERRDNIAKRGDNMVERRQKSSRKRGNLIRNNRLNDYAVGEDFQSGKYPRNVSYIIHYSGNEKSYVDDGVDIGEVANGSGNGGAESENYGGRQEEAIEMNFGVDDREEKNTVPDKGGVKGEKDYKNDGEDYKKDEKKTLAKVVHDNENSDWKSELKRLLVKSNQREEKHQDVRHNKNGDSCDQWIQCKYHSLRRYLKQLEKLPSCPCVFPNIMWHNQLWDEHRKTYFMWEVANSPGDRRDIYRPGAKFCIRSLLEPGMITLAVQHCCYDVKQRLITRGRAAGTPNLISPQISWELHKKIDILPWVLCKGDWLRYHQMVPPNNAVKCEENPKDREFYKQIMDLRNI